MVIDEHTLNVESWLLELGFNRTSEGYVYMFHNDEIDINLSVVLGYNRHFLEVFNVAGVGKTSRELAEFSGEIPPSCDSKEQVAAIIAHIVRSFSAVLWHFKVDLFLFGEANKELLPWVIQQKERDRLYDSRPYCHVNRDWFTPFRKQLRELFSDHEREIASSNVTVRFDGNLLLFDCGPTRLKLPAEGAPWEKTLVVEPRVLTSFPRRFNLPTVVVDYWEGYLRLGNTCYEVLTHTQTFSC